MTMTLPKDQRDYIKSFTTDKFTSVEANFVDHYDRIGFFIMQQYESEFNIILRKDAFNTERVDDWNYSEKKPNKITI